MKETEEKKLCPARFAMLREHLDVGVGYFPEYYEDFLRINMEAAKHNLEGCADATCPACLAGGNPRLYLALIKVALVNDGVRPEEAINDLDIAPLVLPEIFAEIIEDPASPRARNLAMLLDREEIERGFDWINGAREVLIAEMVALNRREGLEK
jgi:hypothetical protein